MKRKAIAAILLSAMLFSACSKPDTSTPTDTETSATAAATAVAEAAATTAVGETAKAGETGESGENGAVGEAGGAGAGNEAAGESESSANSPAANTVRIDKSVDDVINTILDATGDEYFVFDDDADMWQATISHSEGIVDYKTCGYISRLEGEDMVKGYNTIYIVFEVYELDMESEQYKHVCEKGELIISRGEDSFTKKHAFVNGQFVLIACGALCNDDEFHYGTDPQELEPPYTIGKVQEGYDAFIALK